MKRTGRWKANVHHLLRRRTAFGESVLCYNHRYLPGPVTLYVSGNNEHLTEQNAFAQLRWEQQYGRWNFFGAGKADWRESKYLDIAGRYPGGRLDQRYKQNEIYASAGASIYLANAHGSSGYRLVS